ARRGVEPSPARSRCRYPETGKADDGSGEASAIREERGALVEQGVRRRRERVQDLRLDRERLPAEQRDVGRNGPRRLRIDRDRARQEAIQQECPQIHPEWLLDVRRERDPIREE